MHQPSLYLKSNNLQKNNIVLFLNNYFRLVQWKKDSEDAILDIGCGPGDVTTDILLPLLPKTFRKLVGIDISEEMVNFAKTHYEKSKISFEQMDIGTENVPSYFEEVFDHIFSFNCLHWVQNQRKCFANVMKMLKPGGDILLLLVVGLPTYEIYEALSKNIRWKSYMENYKNYVSPYQNSENPKTELETLLKDVGFEVELCKIEPVIYVYPTVADFIESLILAVNPFYYKIPDNLKREYLSDFMTEVRQLNLIEIKDNNEERVNFSYKQFVVYARKTL